MYVETTYRLAVWSGMGDNVMVSFSFCVCEHECS